MTTKLVFLSSASLAAAFGAVAVAEVVSVSPCRGRLRFRLVLSGDHLPASQLPHLYYPVRPASSSATKLASTVSLASSACHLLTAARFTVKDAGYTCSERFISGSFDGVPRMPGYQSR